jgi:hypothetical protein
VSYHGHLVNAPLKIAVYQPVWIQAGTANVSPKPPSQGQQNSKKDPHGYSKPFNAAVATFGRKALADSKQIDHYLFSDFSGQLHKNR